VSAGLVLEAVEVMQPAVRYAVVLSPAAVAAVATPAQGAALRGAYAAALALPIEAVLIAGTMDVATGAVTRYLLTDDVNVAGNGADAAAVLDALLGGGGGRRRAAQPAPARRRRALSAAPNALNIDGLAPPRNASSRAVAVFFNALAFCPGACSDAQSAAAAGALRARVAATATNGTLLAGALPPGVGWGASGAAIPFTLPRARIRWRLLAWLQALPMWVIIASAAGGGVACLSALGALWLWRKKRRAKDLKVEDERASAAAAAAPPPPTPAPRRPAEKAARGAKRAQPPPQAWADDEEGADESGEGFSEQGAEEAEEKEEEEEAGGGKERGGEREGGCVCVWVRETQRTGGRCTWG